MVVQVGREKKNRLAATGARDSAVKEDRKKLAVTAG